MKKITDALGKRRKIAQIWAVVDVINNPECPRPDLTAEQAWEVLQKVDQKWSASVGVNWTVLAVWTDHLFPRGQE